MLKVVLIDDHVLMRDALAKLIHSFTGYTILFCAGNGTHFRELLDPSNLPDLVLMDVMMPGMNGFETTSWISTHHPQIKVIALSMQNDERTVIRMLRNGAKGYLLKDTDVDELKNAMNEVANKGIYINEILYKNIVHSIASNQQPTEEAEKQIAADMTEREKIFLRWLCTEKSYKEIAAEMFLSPRTIDGYRDGLFEKLGVKTRVGLVMYAIKRGIVEV